MDGFTRKMAARLLGKLGLGDLVTPWGKSGGATDRAYMGDTNSGKGLAEQGVDARGAAHGADNAIRGESRGTHGVGGDATRGEVRDIAGNAIGDQDNAFGVGIRVDGGAGSIGNGTKGSYNNASGGLGGALDCGANVVVERRKDHAMLGNANAQDVAYIAPNSLGDAKGAPGVDLRAIGDTNGGLDEEFYHNFSIHWASLAHVPS
ncbi:unnamed protein product [Ilex paraguariensis]|uniref:Uncharacterized protein n=1 Tax=Ilex paraguariensis TaxID=185542 RepID=A0ABC8V346_9AQUA